MPRADDLAGTRFHHARSLFISFIRVRSENVIGDAVVDSIRIVLVATAAVKAIIASCMLLNEGPLRGMPIPDMSVHFPLSFEYLPIVPRAQDRLFFSSQFGHADEFVDD